MRGGDANMPTGAPRPARWPAVVIRGGTALFLLLLSALIIVLCTRCTPATEQRKNCITHIEPHPTLPYPAGVIVVTCDGLERARIVARRIYAQH
jgi:hypothetical protein